MKHIACLMLFFALIAASCQESLDERCEREAREYTRKKCPAKIDEWTVVDSMTFDRATKTVAYYYTMSGPADNASVYSDTKVRQLLLDQLRNATSVKEYKEAGYNFKYTYTSEKEPGKVLCTVTITKEDYNRK